MPGLDGSQDRGFHRVRIKEGHSGAAMLKSMTFPTPALRAGAYPPILLCPREGLFAADIWGPWYQNGSEFRNRKEFLEEAIALAPVGVISFAR
jgi:hypothetical protein